MKWEFKWIGNSDALCCCAAALLLLCHSASSPTCSCGLGFFNPGGGGGWYSSPVMSGQTINRDPTHWERDKLMLRYFCTIKFSDSSRVVRPNCQKINEIWPLINNTPSTICRQTENMARLVTNVCVVGHYHEFWQENNSWNVDSGDVSNVAEKLWEMAHAWLQRRIGPTWHGVLQRITCRRAIY